MKQTGFLDIQPSCAVELKVPGEGTSAPHERARTLLGRRPERVDAPTYAPLATWAIVSALGLAASGLGSQPTPALVVAGALLLASLFVVFERFSLFLTAVAVIPAALGGNVPAAAWLAAGLLVAIAVGRSRAPVVVSMNELERHLSWCRRRQEPADVLAARIEDGAVHDPAQLVRAFRITDSVELRHRAGGYDLVAVLDHQELDREGLENRINAFCARPVTWGWALFPRDGVTLDVLVERARHAAAGGPVLEPAPYRGDVREPRTSVA